MTMITFVRFFRISKTFFPAAVISQTFVQALLTFFRMEKWIFRSRTEDGPILRDIEEGVEASNAELEAAALMYKKNLVSNTVLIYKISHLDINQCVVHNMTICPLWLARLYIQIIYKHWRQTPNNSHNNIELHWFPIIYSAVHQDTVDREGCGAVTLSINTPGWTEAVCTTVTYLCTHATYRYAGMYLDLHTGIPVCTWTYIQVYRCVPGLTYRYTGM